MLDHTYACNSLTNFEYEAVLPSKVRMVVMTEHTTDELHFLEVHVKLNQNCRAVHVLLPARAGGAACSGSGGGGMAQEAVAARTVVPNGKNLPKLSKLEKRCLS